MKPAFVNIRIIVKLHRLSDTGKIIQFTAFDGLRDVLLR
jgi:hypothetical protein